MFDFRRVLIFDCDASVLPTPAMAAPSATHTLRSLWSTTSRLLALCLVLVCAAVKAQPLPSWNDGVSKQQILNFVADVTTPGSSAFVPVEDRIAVFDNDGTLWAE